MRKLVKDFRKYQNKVLWQLDMRQTLLVLGGGVLLFILLMLKVPAEIFWTVAIISAIIVTVGGWYKPYNVPVEQYVKSVLKQGPKTIRKYRPNTFSKLPIEIAPKQPKEKDITQKRIQ